jgi:hypothetical protein
MSALYRCKSTKSSVISACKVITDKAHWAILWLECLPLDPMFVSSDPAEGDKFYIALAGLVVSILATRRKVHRSNWTEDDGLLRAGKIRCTTSLGGK